MFRKFAYQFAGQGDAGEQNTEWVPPWIRRGIHRVSPHMAHPLYMRRMGGPFGRGGRGGPFGFDRGERFLGRGDMKFALLELLSERPMYGYEMIKVLEEKSGGFYAPSPGSIYPTLQMLEERNFVTSQEIEGKKVYTITETGSALLEEHQRHERFTGPPWARSRYGHEERHRGLRLEMQALHHETMEVARLFMIAGRSAINDSAQVTRLRAIIERTRKELADLIYGEGGAPSDTSRTPPPDIE